MIINKRKLFNLKRVIFFYIFVSIFLYPFNKLTGQTKVIHQPVIFKDEALELLPAVDIKYFHSARVEVQGHSSSFEKSNSQKNKQADLSSGVSDQYDNIIKDVGPSYNLPKINYRARKEVMAVVTAYNPVPAQTDSTPCLTANGTEICTEHKNIIAANWLPFGTKVQIPDYFGDKIFEVQDRMNERYSDRIDVLMYDLTEAKRFGKRKLRIIILD